MGPNYSDPRNLSVIENALSVYAPRASARVPDPDHLFADEEDVLMAEPVRRRPKRAGRHGRQEERTHPIVTALTAVVYVVGALIGAIFYVVLFQRITRKT